MTAVEIPTFSNLEEYEWLPGHFNVRYIIEEVSSEASLEPLYRSKLESGETQVVCISFVPLFQLITHNHLRT
jgi:hypothetical protein